jgi:hypothetical protein
MSFQSEGMLLELQENISTMAKVHAQLLKSSSYVYQTTYATHIKMTLTY